LGAKDQQEVKSSQTNKRPKVKAVPVVYTVSQTDRPPLFSTECLTAQDAQKCSNEALEDWMRKNVKYPEADLEEGDDGLTYVTFVINQKGQISTVQRVVSKQESCEGCGQAALDAVTTMPQWTPAMLNGKPVSVRVTLPVRFRVL
jgi:protein TonB